MSEPFVAEIRMFAGNFAPRGWAFCNGQMLAIQQNQALFSLLGVTYGGNGVTTFALPNLGGRAPVHAGNGPGLTPRTLGESGGEATTTITSAQMPAHSHDLRASDSANTGTPGATVALAPTATARVYRSASSLAASAAPLANTGGGQAHENRQPYLGINFIVALQGIFPARN